MYMCVAVCLEPLRMPKELLDDLKAKKITFTQASELDKKIMKETDVLYVTRVQVGVSGCSCMDGFPDGVGTCMV